MVEEVGARLGKRKPCFAIWITISTACRPPPPPFGIFSALRITTTFVSGTLDVRFAPQSVQWCNRNGGAIQAFVRCQDISVPFGSEFVRGVPVDGCFGIRDPGHDQRICSPRNWPILCPGVGRRARFGFQSCSLDRPGVSCPQNYCRPRHTSSSGPSRSGMALPFQSRPFLRCSIVPSSSWSSCPGLHAKEPAMHVMKLCSPRLQDRENR